MNNRIATIKLLDALNLTSVQKKNIRYAYALQNAHGRVDAYRRSLAGVRATLRRLAQFDLATEIAHCLFVLTPIGCQLGEVAEIEKDNVKRARIEAVGGGAPMTPVKLAVRVRTDAVEFILPAETTGLEDRIVGSDGTYSRDGVQIVVAGVRVWVKRGELCDPDGELLESTFWKQVER